MTADHIVIACFALFGVVLLVGLVLIVMTVRRKLQLQAIEIDTARKLGQLRIEEAAAGVRAALGGSAAAALAGLGTRNFRLPVVQECETCVHFDLEEGQAILHQHPSFMMAASILSPSMIGRGVEFNEHSAPMPEGGVPAKAQWKDFGACAHHHEGRWRHDRCDNWAARGLADANGNSIAGASVGNSGEVTGS